MGEARIRREGIEPHVLVFGNGHFLMAFDVDATSDAHRAEIGGEMRPYPTGSISATPNIKEARQFASRDEAIGAIQTTSTVTPFRPDGLPNRPLTAVKLTALPVSMYSGTRTVQLAHELHEGILESVRRTLRESNVVIGSGGIDAIARTVASNALVHVSMFSKGLETHFLRAVEAQTAVIDTSMVALQNRVADLIAENETLRPIGEKFHTSRADLQSREKLELLVELVLAMGDQSARPVLIVVPPPAPPEEDVQF